MQEFDTLAGGKQRQWHMRSVLLRLATALIVVMSLALVGCDDGGGDFDGVEEGDLQGRTFETLDCRVLGVTGGCTIAIGNFAGGTAPITITTNPTATGTIDVDEESAIDDASCVIVIQTSDFPAGQGPQVSDIISIDPCVIDQESDQLRWESNNGASFFSLVQTGTGSVSN